MSNRSFFTLLIAAAVVPVLYFKYVDNSPGMKSLLSDRSSPNEPADPANSPFSFASNSNSTITLPVKNGLESSPFITSTPSPAQLFYDSNGRPIQPPAIMNEWNGASDPNSSLTPAGVAGTEETMFFHGNAYGPDLSSPMEFNPTVSFQEIIRFDVNPDWVKSRWDRVSTSASTPGLFGMRVPLVTGTNPWDLHGSLTYYFDSAQQAQRITFRGWTGDATQLLNLLNSQFGFKKQKTLQAGFYLAENYRGRPTGGVLLQHPTVIRNDNSAQQLALFMEINNPQGPFKLSDQFQSASGGFGTVK